jgi:hypothetical protein
MTQDELKHRIHYDPRTGEFTWIVPWGRHGRFPPGLRAGCAHQGSRRKIFVSDRNYSEHHLAFLYMLGRWPAKPHVDHINGDPLDNRWANLREATIAENGANKAAQVSHGHKWAYPRGKRWISLIRVHGKQKYLGTFETANEASDAAFAISKSLYGEFARR